MKKLFLTAAFTLVGNRSISTSTPQKPADTLLITLRQLKLNNRIHRLQVLRIRRINRKNHLQLQWKLHLQRIHQ